MIVGHRSRVRWTPCVGRSEVAHSGYTLCRGREEDTARLHDDFEQHALRFGMAKNELYLRTTGGMVRVVGTDAVYGRALSNVQALRAAQVEKTRKRTVRKTAAEGDRERTASTDRSAFLYRADGHQWRCRAGHCVCPDIEGEKLTGTGGGKLGTVKRSAIEMEVPKPQPWTAKRVRMFYGM